jgi:hypothetical protein
LLQKALAKSPSGAVKTIIKTCQNGRDVEFPPRNSERAPDSFSPEKQGFG